MKKAQPNLKLFEVPSPKNGNFVDIHFPTEKVFAKLSVIPRSQHLARVCTPCNGIYSFTAMMLASNLSVRMTLFLSCSASILPNWHLFLLKTTQWPHPGPPRGSFKFPFFPRTAADQVYNGPKNGLFQTSAKFPINGPASAQTLWMQ